MTPPTWLPCVCSCSSYVFWKINFTLLSSIFQWLYVYWEYNVNSLTLPQGPFIVWLKASVPTRSVTTLLLHFSPFQSLQQPVILPHGLRTMFCFVLAVLVHYTPFDSQVPFSLISSDRLYISWEQGSHFKLFLNI